MCWVHSDNSPQHSCRSHSLPQNCVANTLMWLSCSALLKKKMWACHLCAADLSDLTAAAKCRQMQIQTVSYIWPNIGGWFEWMKMRPMCLLFETEISEAKRQSELKCCSKTNLLHVWCSRLGALQLEKKKECFSVFKLSKVKFWSSKDSLDHKQLVIEGRDKN